MPHRQKAARNRSPENRAAELARPPGIASWQWFVLAAGIPLAIGASRLNLDLWHDEIYTITRFVSRGPKVIVTDYSLPNNHVLYSLLLWPVYRFSDSNFMLRLPSLACMAGTLVLVFRLAQRSGGIGAAVLATALLGLNQMFLIHTVQVRGYPLAMLLTIGLATAVPTANDAGGWHRRAVIVVAGAAYLYVLPTNLLFLVPLTLVACTVAARNGGMKSAAVELGAWGAAALVALLAYLPIAGQVLKAGGGRGPAMSAGIGAGLLQMFSNAGRLAIGFLSPAAHDVWWLGPMLVAGLLVWALRRSRAAQCRPASGLMLVLVTWCGAFVLSGALRISPFERNYSPLLPLTALAAGCLLDELLMAVGPRLSARWSPAWSASVGLVLLLVALGPRLMTYSSRLDARRREIAAEGRWPVQDGYFNYYAANFRPSAVAGWLADHHVERMPYAICIADEDQIDISYYLSRAGLPPFHGLAADGEPRPVAVFAVAPAGAPWSRLAGACGLSERQLREFERIGDFGYHQLYQSPRPLRLDHRAIGLTHDNAAVEPGEHAAR